MSIEQQDAESSWVNVCVDNETDPTISFRSGTTVYEESFLRGQYVGRGWNGAGYVSYYGDIRINPLKHPTPQAFWIEIDGQALVAQWEWVGLEQTATEQGLHVVVTLRHALRPLTLKVHTLLDGTPVLARWLEINNTGAQSAALGAAYSWSGVLQQTDRWRNHLAGTDTPLYEVGYMIDTHWGNEGNFGWLPLPNAGYRIDGRYRRDRHRHPMFVVRNNATGEHFIGQLAWSGGYTFEFDQDADIGTGDGSARLAFRAGPDAPAPQRVIASGETIKTPEMHLGMLFGDLDTAIQAMHDHLRRSVFSPQPRGRGGWVEIGIGPELEITVDEVNHAIDEGAKVGGEVFFIDASWYAPPHSHWWNTVGDWEVDLERFPEGVKPFRERAKSHGMLFGLWMDAERIASKSRAAQEHPEWLAVPYDSERKLGDLLDLTNPEVAAWMEGQISQLISKHDLDFFRLDYNVGGLGASSYTVRDGYAENGYWRYYEALYAIYDRLRERFPDVIFENCAGGGGRSDIGMVRRFSHTWVTDWQIAPRSFSITNGMTMALPPEYVDRLLFGQNGYRAAELDFQARQLLFVRPTMGFFKPTWGEPNPQLYARVRHFTDLYKDFVRPFMSEGRIYHHTPVVSSPEPQGWGVLELAARDQTRGIAGIFQLAAPQETTYTFRPRGLDVARRYRVTFDNSGQSSEIDGLSLTQQGLRVRLEGALTSELLIFEAI